ncbi:TPA: exonuclease SbcCD subunit D [Methanopyrus kandleri]|uniref:DNA double-strand break repair protein Mre11 n=3 Tax=Methanopyrus kandleri TaxID=2320 RepID=MRE11_METKA|nr:RecName: Full=DNA double-strand break repair protein Mre11 [Methanopyrus kandleri AV19]AAM01905.1 DNA repair exonuclease of the SbcD/Mre11-family [Methanopyrus kandleri AV19]HII70085.1 exonuclease SbcCD subunit D [Methanopyrus kandleri]
MRMAHVADVHLGHALMNLRSREEAVMETFERLMEEVRECSVDVLVIAGDLFEHARPKTEALYLAVEKLSELKEDGVEIVATAGNHEIRRRKGAVSPISVLERMGLVRHLYYSERRPERHRYTATFDGVRVTFHGLQYLPKNSFVERAKVIRAKYRPDPEADVNVAIFHQALPGTIPDESEIVEPAYFPEGHDYYAMGHVHVPSREEKIHGSPAPYPGSPEPLTFLEVKDERGAHKRRGFFLVEFDRGGLVEYEFVEVEWSRELSVVEVSGERWEEELRRRVRRGQIVKVVAKDTGASPEEVEKVAIEAGADRCVVELRERRREVEEGDETEGPLDLEGIIREGVKRARAATLTRVDVPDDVVVEVALEILRGVREDNPPDLGDVEGIVAGEPPSEGSEESSEEPEESDGEEVGLEVEEVKVESRGTSSEGMSRAGSKLGSSGRPSLDRWIG